MTDRELIQQALEALEASLYPQARQMAAIAALKAALAEPEQEPVAWANLNELTEQFNSVNCGTVYRLPGEGRSPLYTTPPQRKPLTDEQLVEAYCCVNDKEWAIGGMTDARIFARAIERAHNIGEKE